MSDVYQRWCTPGPGDWWDLARWVYRVGNTPSHPPSDIPGSTTARSQIPAKRAPEAPCRGAGVGGYLGPSPWTRSPGLPCTHPAGPVGPPAGPSLVQDPPPRAKGRDLTSFYRNLVKNQEVSPKCVEKACHSPYFQNGPEKSALEILRFPLSSAFSPKELMGLF